MFQQIIFKPAPGGTGRLLPCGKGEAPGSRG